MGGISPLPGGGGGGSTPPAYSYLAFASAAGQQNNVNPPLPATNVRLVVTLASGAASWSGLAGALDGQVVWLVNNDAANVLILQSQNALSLAANRFIASNDMQVFPGAALLLVYTAQGLNRWLVR